MKPYYEEKQDKVNFRLFARENVSLLYNDLISLIEKTGDKNYKFSNSYKEKQRKNSVKLK